MTACLLSYGGLPLLNPEFSRHPVIPMAECRRHMEISHGMQSPLLDQCWEAARSIQVAAHAMSSERLSSRKPDI